MHLLRFLLITFLSFLFMSTSPAQDAAGSSDHYLFNRMPGYRIMRYTMHDFDVFDDFRDENGKKATVEGRFYFYNYGVIKGENEASGPQVLRNYRNAVEAAGGALVLEEGCCNVYLKLIKDDRLFWVRVKAYRQAGSYQLWIIEEEAMEQAIVVNAESMYNDIVSSGRVALYGIYFDFDAAEVRPESKPALEEISKLLSQNPSLSLFVVGHTDNAGDFNYNMKLSDARADAVVAKLVAEYGVDQRRIQGAGVGPLAPVGSNVTEDGKAQNRRVELIRR